VIGFDYAGQEIAAILHGLADSVAQVPSCAAIYASGLFNSLLIWLRS
jgi:hypothetical protein